MHWGETANLPSRVLGDIARHIVDELPKEAVGLVWEAPGNLAVATSLTNTSDTPESSYAVSVAEIITEFEQASGRDIVEALHDGYRLTLWHSHPSGLVGPSRGDVREKVSEGLTYMVIAVGEDESLRATLF